MTKMTRSIKGFATLDDFLEGEGTREAFQAVAIKEVLAERISETMKPQALSRRPIRNPRGKP
jgi:hypothetical protein